MIGLEFVKRFEGGTRVSDSLPTLVRVRLGLSVALSRIPQLKESHERGANLPSADNTFLPLRGDNCRCRA